MGIVGGLRAKRMRGLRESVLGSVSFAVSFSPSLHHLGVLWWIQM